MSLTNAELQALESLADKLLRLTTTQKMTVAIALIQLDRLDTAESVIEAALDDLRSKRLFGIERVPVRGGNKA